jgi:hypothetical protein
MNKVVDSWNDIIGKTLQAKDGTLKHEEFVVFRVFSFIISVEMNGVSGAFYNLSPKLGSDQSKWLDLRLVAEALISIGDKESSEFLFKAADVFENIPEPSPQTWAEFMGLATLKLSEDFWETIESRIPYIYDSLETYTTAHLLSH